MGALQLALVGAASASTLEGGPFLALAIDGVVGQVAAVVHGVCDWYTTGSYLVRRLDALGIRADVGEVRRLTNAALMSKGSAIDERMLARSTELRLIRRWSGNGLVDALPFGSSLGKAAVRAVGGSTTPTWMPWWPPSGPSPSTGSLTASPSGPSAGRKRRRVRAPWPGTSGCARAAGR